MAPPSRCSGSGGTGGVLPLPLDELYEILLRLTAKELCSLRAVSRPWRSLLSDLEFIAAHAARHPGPLFVASHGLASGYPDGNVLCEIMDLSGKPVKRIRGAGVTVVRVSVLSAQLDLVQVVRGMGNSCRLLNPATGAVSTLPERLAHEHAAHQLNIYKYRAGFVLGKVASTGKYKVLRVFDNILFEPNSEQLCKVFTLDGSSNARWRANKASADPVDVHHHSTAVVSGIVYFLVNENYWNQHHYHRVMPKFIASFDLGTEEWRKTLQVPQLRFEGFSGDLPSNHMDFNSLTLAALNDCLAVVHCMRSSYIDIWFLMDFEKGLWVRQNSIQIKPNALDDGFHVHPLLVLNDGRIVTYTETRGSLSIYNPRTTAYTDLALARPYVVIGLYTGNLLSLLNDHS